jgi:hypothetical protein
MITLKQAAQQALEAMSGVITPANLRAAREALRQALEAEQQDEPVGYFKAEPFGWTDCAETDEGAVALYERPHQPAQQPLTEEQIRELMNQSDDECMANPDSQAPWSAKPWSTRFARAIERAHGIGGEV